MAEAIRLESVTPLTADIINVDRPVPDALGYLVAALDVKGRSLLPGRLERLEAVCKAWIGECYLVFMTELDRQIPIGLGRNGNDTFRVAAGKTISEILSRIAPGVAVTYVEGADAALATALNFAERLRVLV
ncbi:hypothetical protein BH09PSE3_BH09PSE3_12160 [soil metagenome]